MNKPPNIQLSDDALCIGTGDSSLVLKKEAIDSVKIKVLNKGFAWAFLACFVGLSILPKLTDFYWDEPYVLNTYFAGVGVYVILSFLKMFTKVWVFAQGKRYLVYYTFWDDKFAVHIHNRIALWLSGEIEATGTEEDFGEFESEIEQ